MNRYRRDIGAARERLAGRERRTLEHPRWGVMERHASHALANPGHVGSPRHARAPARGHPAATRGLKFSRRPQGLPCSDPRRRRIAGFTAEQPRGLWTFDPAIGIGPGSHSG